MLKEMNYLYYGCGEYERRRGLNDETKAALFGLFLVVLFVASLIIGFLSSPPIVLGSEMNTNGKVEYLCLGRGCDGIR